MMARWLRTKWTGYAMQRYVRFPRSHHSHSIYQARYCHLRNLLSEGQLKEGCLTIDTHLLLLVRAQKKYSAFDCTSLIDLIFFGFWCFHCSGLGRAPLGTRMGTVSQSKVSGLPVTRFSCSPARSYLVYLVWQALDVQFPSSFQKIWLDLLIKLFLFSRKPYTSQRTSTRRVW